MRRRFGLIILVLATACGAALGPAAAADCRPVSQVESYRFELCAAAEGPGQRLRLLQDGAEVFVVEDHRIEVYCTSFRPMQTAFIERPDRVLFKLIVDTDSRRVLGCHIVAPNAGELIQLAGVAVKMGATKEDFDRTVAVHPTISEELVTMHTPVRTA